MDIISKNNSKTNSYILICSLFLAIMLVITAGTSAVQAKDTNFETAFNTAMKNNTAVNLSNNVSLKQNLLIEKTVTIKSDKKVTINTGEFAILVGEGTHLIIDGNITIKGSGLSVINVEGGKLTLKKGAIINDIKINDLIRSGSQKNAITAYLKNMSPLNVEKNNTNNFLQFNKKEAAYPDYAALANKQPPIPIPTAVYIQNGEFNMNGGSIQGIFGVYSESANININGGNILAEIYGIFDVAGVLNISNSKVTTVNSFTQAVGIFAPLSAVTISNSNISVDSFASFGLISQNNDISISGGSISATGTMAAFPIQASSGDLSINNTNISAANKIENGQCFGIYVQDMNTTINGVSLNVSGFRSFGAIFIDSSAASNNSQISATGDDSIGVISTGNSLVTLDKSTKIEAPYGLILDTGRADLVISNGLYISGVYYFDFVAYQNSGNGNPFDYFSPVLNSIPTPVTVTEGVSTTYFDCFVPTFSISGSTSSELNAVLDGSTVEMDALLGQYQLVLTTDIEFNELNLLIPVTVERMNYIVTFDKNGGYAEASPNTRKIYEGRNLGSLPKAPKRIGYTFTGWNTATDGSGTAVTANTIITDNITVYAQWKKTSRNLL